jgi:uncharacterized protein with von Willebrand factor type A (vWA) domain
MDARLREFADLLRQNGLRVSPAELADAAGAALTVGLERRDELRAALRATLIKRGSDAHVFDRLFQLYFSGSKDLVEGLQRSLLQQLEEQGMTEADLEEVARTLLEMPFSPLADALLTGDLGELARLLRQATLSVDFRGLQSPLQRNFYARRVAQAAGGGQAEAEMGAFLARLREQGLDARGVEMVSRQTSNTLRELEEAARRVAERELQQRDPERRAQGDLAFRNLNALTPAEVDKMRVLVRRLAEKLKARLSRRRKARRRGQLSVRRTLRKNLVNGGVPAQLVFRTRRPERPDVIVLCDVSDSVRNASRLMLHFVYSLQNLYARVRSFVFVSDLGEVTQLFKKLDIDEAVNVATAGRVVNLSANSNYGRALQLFHSTYLGSVTRRTSVVIIGDGRSNYNPPQAWVLGEIKRRARRVLWLCPEDRASWGFGDSEMPLYAKHCTKVEPVKTLDELVRAASELVPT